MIDTLLRRLLRAGWRRGKAGDWTWLVIAGAAYVLRRALNESGGAVSSVTVSPGEQVLITVRDPKALSGDGEAVLVSAAAAAASSGAGASSAAADAS
ncbi:MAG TPA: hypothetical protein VGF87_09170 [Acidimicrobiales bacterium]